MAVPSVQIAYNDEEVRIFWNYDPTGTYVKYDVLYADGANIGIIVDSVPNSPDSYYSKNSIFYKFRRETFSIANTSSFTLQIRAYDSGSTTYLGDTKYVPSLSEELDQYKSTQIHGYDYTNNIWRKVKVDATGTLAS